MTDEVCSGCGARMRRGGVVLNGRLVRALWDAEPYCPNADCGAGDIDTNEETT